MILYICVALVTILMAWECGRVRQYIPVSAEKGNRLKMDDSRARVFAGACLVSIFVILFAVSACRINVGNDYAKYVEFMHRLYTDKYISDPGVPTEWGFNLLARLIYALSGYENFLLVFALYSFATVFIFLAAMWEQSEDFALTFCMFMSLGYYFQSFSTVRYYLALAIALYCMKPVCERRWVRFIVLVLLGTGFHKSILVIIPLYIMAAHVWKKWQLAIAGVLCISCLFLKDFYLSVLVRLYPSYEDTEYLAGSGISWINIFRCGAVLVLAFICMGRNVLADRRMSFYFYLNLGALALYVFCSFVPVVSRIGYYLTVSQILYVPALIGRLENGRRKKLIMAVVLAACAAYLAVYLMKASDDGVLVLPYRTFFFNDMVNIISDVS